MCLSEEAYISCGGQKAAMEEDRSGGRIVTACGCMIRPPGVSVAKACAVRLLRRRSRPLVRASASEHACPLEAGQAGTYEGADEGEGPLLAFRSLHTSVAPCLSSQMGWCRRCGHCVTGLLRMRAWYALLSAIANTIYTVVYPFGTLAIYSTIIVAIRLE